MGKTNYLLSILLLAFSIQIFGQSRNQDYLNYIEQYNQIAVRQQKKYGIPASIILAQGLLESGAGKGRLAMHANNHFGIKCHGWTGEKIFHDDDEKNECFRKYRHAVESYEDHSEFLKTRPRYASLFSLSSSDYVNWAHGLKAAGYATDPAYATKLISLIERYELHQYDQVKTDQLAARKEIEALPVQEQAFVRQQYKSNFLKIIITEPGDTWAGLARETGISEKRLRAYNEVDDAQILSGGNIVYLKKKKLKAALANQIHIVQAGESMYSIAQLYGIQIRSLYKLNQMSYEQGAYVGQVLKLR